MVCRNLSAFADAPRAGSAEAKGYALRRQRRRELMHPVQAAPRQSAMCISSDNLDKGCTPCRQRRGKANSYLGREIKFAMHPVQAAPRQSKTSAQVGDAISDAPRAGSAEAKLLAHSAGLQQF